MPPSANIVSGNTSVCAIPVVVATFSATLPGTAEACGVNASRPPSRSSAVRLRRSAISSVASRPTTRIVP